MQVALQAENAQTSSKKKNGSEKEGSASVEKKENQGKGDAVSWSQDEDTVSPDLQTEANKEATVAFNDILREVEEELLADDDDDDDDENQGKKETVRAEETEEMVRVERLQDW